jgi:hypothetical protein
MCRPCLYTAHVYRDDVTLNLGRYYIYGRNTVSTLPQHSAVAENFSFIEGTFPLLHQ